MNILFVDDCRLQLRLLADCIGGDCAQVDCAGDGARALAAIISKPFGHYRVVLTDLDMPVISGIGLVETLVHASYPAKIIIHSGSVSPFQASVLKSYGVPVVPKGEYGRIRELIGRA